VAPGRDLQPVGTRRSQRLLTTLSRPVNLSEETAMLKRTLVTLALASTVACFSACANRQGAPSAKSTDASLKEASRFFGMGRSAEARKDWADAEVYYRQAIAASPTLAGAWNNLGVVLMQQQNYLEATNAFRRAADLLPGDPTPYENLGLTYQRAGYAADALRAYELSLERDPSWLPSIRGYATSVKLLNRAEEADLRVLQRGLMLESDSKWRDLFNFQRLRIERDLLEAETN